MRRVPSNECNSVSAIGLVGSWMTRGALERPVRGGRDKINAIQSNVKSARAEREIYFYTSDFLRTGCRKEGGLVRGRGAGF